MKIANMMSMNEYIATSLGIKSQLTFVGMYV